MRTHWYVAYELEDGTVHRFGYVGTLERVDTIARKVADKRNAIVLSITSTEMDF